MNENELLASAQQIRESKKYRDLDIPLETIIDLLRENFPLTNSKPQTLKKAKRLLHNIIAPYLDNLDYQAFSQKMSAISKNSDDQEINSLCMDIMSQHDSTKERLPYLQSFYEAIRRICPQPLTILDLACGLNPFALPFMGIPNTTGYFAFDIHSPRVRLINQFFQIINQSGGGEVRDILISPPAREADAVFFFKEAHRMEKRRTGAARELIRLVKGKFIFLSLPNKSLDGRRNLSTRMQRLAAGIFDGELIQEIEFPGETIYWVRRQYA